MNILSCIINKKEKKLSFWYLVTGLTIIQLLINLIDYTDDNIMFIQLILSELFIFIVFIKNIIKIIKSKQSKKMIISYILFLIYGALHFLCMEYYNLYVFFLVDIIISIVMQYIHIRKMDKNSTSLIRLKLIAYIINIAINTIIVTYMLIMLIVNGTKFCYIVNESNRYKKELKYNLDKINIETNGNGSTEEVYIPVCKNNKWGYINEMGEEVIQCKYDEATEFLTIKNRTKTEDMTYLSNIDIAFVRDNNEYRIISKDERIIASSKNSVVPWEIDDKRIYKGFIEIQDYDSKNGVYIWLEKKQHDTDDNYEDTLNIGNNVELIIEKNEDYKYNITAEKNGEIISKVEDVYCLEDLHYSDGSIPFYNLEEKVQGWVDTKGNKYYMNGNYIILDVKDEYIFIKDNVTENVLIFRNGISIGNAEEAIVTQKGYILTYANKKAFYDENLRKVSQNYDEIDDAYIMKDILIVQNNEEYSIIDTKGNVLTNETYDIIKGYANSNEYILEEYYYSDKMEKASEVLKEEYEKYKEEQYFINSIYLK